MKKKSSSKNEDEKPSSHISEIKGEVDIEELTQKINEIIKVLNKSDTHTISKSKHGKTHKKHSKKHKNTEHTKSQNS